MNKCKYLYRFPTLPTGRQVRSGMTGKTNNNRIKNGQSMIEIIVALVVVGLIAVGLVRVSSVSLKNVRYASEETEAVAAAEKKMAELKASAVNDATFWSFPKTNDTGLIGDYCYLVIVENNKSDLPTITTPRYNEADMAQATVYIFWGSKTENKDCLTKDRGTIHYDHNIELATLLTK